MSSLGQPQGNYDHHPTYSCGVGETDPGVSPPTMEQEGAWQEGQAVGKWPVHFCLSPFYHWSPWEGGDSIFSIFIFPAPPQFLVNLCWFEAKKRKLEGRVWWGSVSTNDAFLESNAKDRQGLKGSSLASAGVCASSRLCTNFSSITMGRRVPSAKAP